MTEYNEKADRVSANNWFCSKGALAELDALQFAYAAMALQCGEKGSCQRETATNAAIGFRHRVDYLHDSLRRLLKSA